MARTALLAALTFMAASCTSLRLFGVKIPEPRGELSVGRFAVAWTDGTRTDPWVRFEDAPRRLLVNIWYPAEAPPRDARPTDYFGAFRALGRSIKFFEGWSLRALRSHTYENAEVSRSENRYPVLLFSHGAESPSYYYTGLIEELASWGFIVVSVEHTYEAKGQVFPYQFIARSEAQSFRPAPGSANYTEREAAYFTMRTEVRTSDLIYVIDRLHEMQAEATGGGLGARLDLARIGVFGHEVGGVAAATTCRLDARVKACLDMDGLASAASFPPALDMSQPFMQLLNPVEPLTEKEIMLAGRTPESQAELMRQRQTGADQLLGSISGETIRVTIPVTDDRAFSDLIFFPPRFSSSERVSSHTMVRDYVRAFFEKQLHNDGGRMLDSLARLYPSVRVERMD